MATTTTKSAYWQGVRSGAPFLFVVAPFGLLFGVVATEAGLNLTQTIGFSVIVLAGASQFAALQLMQDNAPALIIVATALAVNLRMAMYSASLAPHLAGTPLWKRALASYFLVDQVYAVSIAKYEHQPDMRPAARLSYYFGAISFVIPAWYAATMFGAIAGAQIPPEFALDFAVPITFLALIAPMLRTLAHVAAALVSVAGALALAFLPFNLGLLLAAVLAMITGAQVELWMERAQK